VEKELPCPQNKTNKMKNNAHINSFTFDEPVEFKGLKIYPVTIKEYFPFLFAVECLLVDKNSIPDSKIISMQYLDYIVYSANAENNHMEKLAGLLYLCLKEKIEDIQYKVDEKNQCTLTISGIDITSSDFEEMKEIILEQNLIELPDYTIQKEIRDKIEEGKRLRMKGNGRMASLEDQIISLSVSSGISLDEIYKMTYRKFSKALGRMDLLIHYKIFLQSSMSGMVEFKDKSFIKHWLTEIKSDNDSDMIELDVMKKKISFEDKK